jgi:hypothetical protein
MSEIVHITFEKLTGLKGTIEGTFIVSNFGLWPKMVDTALPVVYLGDGMASGGEINMVFRQGVQYFILQTFQPDGGENYFEHFEYGVNFLIKEWSYGGGVKINRVNPN